MADIRAELRERLERLRQAAANAKTPLQIRLEAERERDASLKAASAAKVAQYQAGNAA